jgi:hypothetical protein
VPAEQRLLHVQRSTATAFNALQCAQKSEHARVAHRTDYRTCPVHHRTAQWPHKSELQRSNPNGLLTWLAHRTVRWRTGLSRALVDSSLHQRSSLVVGAINTPTTPTFKSSKFFTFQLLTRVLAFNSRHNQRDQSSPKSGITPNQIVTRESDTCVHLSSCAWIASFSHSFLRSSQL